MWTVGGEFLPVCELIQGHVRKGTHHYGQEMGAGGRSPRVGENICSVREGVSACVRMRMSYHPQHSGRGYSYP